MFRPVYEPRTKAKEYCDLAVNIYTSCNHSCSYCYARRMFNRYHPNENFADVKLREGIVEATKRQLSGGKYKDKKILLCFMCDPYPAGIDTTPTREIITVIKEAGANFSILTKGGMRAERDFDLYGQGDSFGVTISCAEEMRKTVEPNAAPVGERVLSLMDANAMSIKTWVSFEPVFEESAIYFAIKECSFVDLFKIGKLNYMKSDINWSKFGRECERLCKKYKRNYYIKEDLRKEMQMEGVRANEAR